MAMSEQAFPPSPSCARPAAALLGTRAGQSMRLCVERPDWGSTSDGIPAHGRAQPV